MQTLHNTRTSICPVCHRILGADYVQDDKGLQLEKFCPEHGSFSTRIAMDYEWLQSRQQYAARTVIPAIQRKPIKNGCPADCGECAGHHQKSAFFLFELTSSCDLNCPICLGQPNERGQFISTGQMKKMVKAVVDYAGPGQIVTLGGGEPTLHPEFFEMVDILRDNGMRELWLYTNGRRIAKDTDFVRRLAELNLYVVLQWDGFSDAIYTKLRGARLLEEKRLAMEKLKSCGMRTGLCPTVVSGVNDGELGKIYEMFISDDLISTLDIATMAYVGRGSNFKQGLRNRTTSQDVTTLIEKQTNGKIKDSDFSPVSFSHPECLQIAYLLAMPDGSFFPLKRFLEPNDYKALICNKPLLDLNPDVEATFNDVINKLWAKQGADPDVSTGLKALRHLIDSLFPKGKPLSTAEFKARSTRLVKVVLVHSYMDGLNFDIGRTKMCISRTVLPDGRLMPTCAYNVVHRSRHIDTA